MFNSNELEYNLVIADEDKLNITPVLRNDDIHFEIIGNENLVDGSIISILLSDDNGNSRTYKININKNDGNTSKDKLTTSKNNTSIIFYIIIGVLVVINIVRILISKMKKNNS